MKGQLIVFICGLFKFWKYIISIIITTTSTILFLIILEPKAESVPEPLDALDQFFRLTCNREDRNNKCAEQEFNEEIELFRKNRKIDACEN